MTNSFPYNTKKNIWLLCLALCHYVNWKFTVDLFLIYFSRCRYSFTYNKNLLYVVTRFVMSQSATVIAFLSSPTDAWRRPWQNLFQINTLSQIDYEKLSICKPLPAVAPAVVCIHACTRLLLGFLFLSNIFSLLKQLCFMSNTPILRVARILWDNSDST